MFWGLVRGAGLYIKTNLVCIGVGNVLVVL